MKRKLSILLAAAMVTSMLPVGVLGATSNSITSTPQMTTNSEWSIKEGNVNTAPQLVFEANNDISAGEQVTLTLTGAEWAFYNIGNYDTNSNDVRNAVQYTQGTDPDTGKTKYAPWISDKVAASNTIERQSVDPDGTSLSNSVAEQNLKAAARVYVYSRNDGGSTPTTDYDPGSSSGDNVTVDTSVTKLTVTDRVYADANDYNSIYNNTNSPYTAYNTALNNYNTAVSTYNTALNDLNSKKAIYNNMAAGYDKDHYYTDTMLPAQNAHDVAETAKNTTATSLKTAIQVINSRIDTLRATSASNRSNLTTLASTYNTAKANLDSLISLDIATPADYQKVDDAALAFNNKAKETQGKNVSSNDGVSLNEIAEVNYVPDTSGNYPVTASSDATKTVGKINFKEVNFEAYNVLSFRLNQNIVKGDKIAIPLLVKVYETSPTVQITSPTGQFTSSNFTIASVSTAATVVTTGSTPSFADTANLEPIVISESTPGAFKSNDRYTNFIRLTLPSGFAWVKTGTSPWSKVTTGTGVTYEKSGGLDVSGWVTSTNSSINRNANITTGTSNDEARYRAGSAIIDPNDNGVLVVALSADNSFKYNTEVNAISKITVTGAKISSKKATAKEGDVTANITGQNVTSQKLTLAVYGDYKILFDVKDGTVVDRVAGRSYLKDSDNVKSSVVRFEENVENSWYPERRTEFVVNKGDIRAVDVKVLDSVTSAGDGTATDLGISHGELVNGVTVTNTVEDLSGNTITQANVDKDTVLDGDNEKDFKRGYFKGGTRDFGDYLYITSNEGSNRDFRRFVMNEFNVASTLNNIKTGERKSRTQMELTFYVEVKALSDGWNKPEDKDLTLTLQGGAVAEKDQRTIKITNLKEPLTISEYKTTDVNLGYQNVPLDTVTVTENFVAGFQPVFNSPAVKGNDDLKFRVMTTDALKDNASAGAGLGANEAADTPQGVTDGKVVGDVLIKDHKVIRESSEISKIMITPTVDLVRYIPVGKYPVELQHIDELGSNVELPDFINVITAAENQTTNYASDVKIVVDGKTTVMKVGDKEFTMNAPAFNKDDLTMLPLRDVAKALGISENNIGYDDETGYATIGAFNRIINVKDGSKIMKLDGGDVPMLGAAYIDPTTQRMYVPIGDLARALNIQTQWDEATNTATLNPTVKTGTNADLEVKTAE